MNRSSCILMVILYMKLDIFTELLAENSAYVIVEPLKTSMLLLVEDVGIIRFIKIDYEQEYTSNMYASTIAGRRFVDV